MGFKSLVNRAFGRNMTVTIDRGAIDRMLETLGRSVPERDGEQTGLLAVAKHGNSAHICYFLPVPPHSATSHLVMVDHDVMNGMVKHTLEPYDMAVGGLLHTQPANDSRLSPDDKSGSRSFIRMFRRFYGADAPNYFLAPVMHFDAQRNPQITTWVFDAQYPNKEPVQAKMDVTTHDGRHMEVNNYIRMKQHNAPALDRFFDSPAQSR